MDKGSVIDYGGRMEVLNKLQGRYYPNMEKRAKMTKQASGNLLKGGDDDE